MTSSIDAALAPRRTLAHLESQLWGTTDIMHDDRGLMTFDHEVTNPPFSLKDWATRVGARPTAGVATATAEQRLNWKVVGGGFGIHWPDLDEDLSTEGLLRGAPAPRSSSSAAA